MRISIYNFITSLISTILVVVAGVTPLLFLNLTTDFYDMPKLVLLVVTAIVTLGLWIASWVARGKIVITRTPLDVPLLLMLLTILASTFFSTSRYSSIFGVFPEVHGSAAAWVTYIVLYFIAVSNLRTTGQIKIFLYVLLVSASVLSFISIFSFFQVFLPLELARGVNFTPTGAPFSTAALLLMLLPISLSITIQEDKHLPQIFSVLVSILFSVTIVLIGSVTVNVILVVLFIVIAYVSRKHLTKDNLPFFLIPLSFALLTLMLVYIPFSGNAIQGMKHNFPQEVQLPLNVTWKISASAFRDAPFVGTGPSTFLFNFTNYKPAEFNQLRVWNFSFSTGFNEFLQALGTWGLFGLLSLIVLSIVIVASSTRNLAKLWKKSAGKYKDSQMFLSALAISGLVAVVLLFVHATTLVTVIATVFLLAAFMSSQKQIREKPSEFSFGIKLSSSGKDRIDLLPVLVLVLFLAGAVPLSRQVYNAVAADYYHRLALAQADKDGTKTYEYLQQAEQLNPYIDLYRVDLAQTNFALANTLASQKGPTQENPEGTLTAEDEQTIQTLVTQAINEGRASVVLSPRSARNWEVLALIYRNISGVANNAITFSLDAYGRAIQMDPLNPALRVDVGSLYYATENYDLAVRFFSDAVNLKPDYINGYYNLALALREKGDLQNAQQVAEQAVRLLQQDFSSQEYDNVPEQIKESKIRDFNTASTLLTEIRNEINSSTEEDEDTGLQNPELPSIDVPNLENPPSTELPPAVEQNPDAELPQIDQEVATPTPTLSQ